MENKKHTLAFIKSQAKKLKKKCSISHTEALERVSKSHGYSNWIHCSRSLNQQKTHVNNVPDQKNVPDKSLELSFTSWLKKHSNRNSPLGDLAKDVIDDETWPSYDTLDKYQMYLLSRNASYGAMNALDKAWKSYKSYLKRKLNNNKPTTKKVTSKTYDQRKIVYFSKLIPIPYKNRTVEKFIPGDKAWISWDGRKAIPVTVTEVNDRHYSFTIERPLKKAGRKHFVFLDEVRSTPELACLNNVTL